MMMHPQSPRVMKKKRQQQQHNISKRKKKTTTTTPTPTPTPTSSEPSLPDDIIFFYILPKLPVRSLLRFNSVSKLWYNTIHHPNFHATQFSHAKSNPSLVAMLRARSNFICFLQLLKEEGGGHHHHHQLNSSNNNNNNNNIASLELESGSSIIVGTCNGLTCNRLSSAIQICNPSTRELLNIRVPKPTTQMERKALMLNGFGFDPVMNEYKVIHIWLDYREYYDCSIYTLGTNRWRNVTATCNYQPYCYPGDSTPICTGGIRLWNVDLSPICISETLFWRTNRVGRILSFDLHHEKFHLIAGPKVPQVSGLHTLFELEGRLCLVYRYDDHLKDEVQLTLFTACEDHQQLRLVHIASSTCGGARWIRAGYICLPLKPEIILIRFVEFAKHIFLHWVTMDGHFILWDVNRKRSIHNKLLGLHTRQWVLLVNHVENLLSLKTFVPPSLGEVEVKYFSSMDAKHESPDGEMKKKKRRRPVYDSHGYQTIPYWLSIII